MDDPELRVWGRELAVEGLNLQLLRLNKRLLLLNVRLLRMNVELLKRNAEKTPRMNRLLRRLRALRLDVMRRLRKSMAPMGAGEAVDDPGLELVRLEISDLMRLLDAMQAEELLMRRRTGG
jgi:hypothetical protein